MAKAVALKSLTIPNGAAISNILDSSIDYVGLSGIIMIMAPAVLDALTFTIEVGNDGINFFTLTSDGTVPLTLPIATKAKAYYFELNAAKYLRLKASGNVAADRIFLLSGWEGTES
jgi:hypothetical protein